MIEQWPSHYPLLLAKFHQILRDHDPSREGIISLILESAQHLEIPSYGDNQHSYTSNTGDPKPRVVEKDSLQEGIPPSLEIPSPRNHYYYYPSPSLPSQPPKIPKEGMLSPLIVVECRYMLQLLLSTLFSPLARLLLEDDLRGLALLCYMTKAITSKHVVSVYPSWSMKLAWEKLEQLHRVGFLKVIQFLPYKEKRGHPPKGRREGNETNIYFVADATAEDIQATKRHYLDHYVPLRLGDPLAQPQGSQNPFCPHANSSYPPGSSGFTKNRFDPADPNYDVTIKNWREIVTKNPLLIESYYPRYYEYLGAQAIIILEELGWKRSQDSCFLEKEGIRLPVPLDERENDHAQEAKR